MAKVVAEALAKSPGLNGFIRFGVYHQHPTVDVSFIVNIGEGADLAKVKVVGLDQKSIVELARELRNRATKVRGGDDQEFEKSKGAIREEPSVVDGQITVRKLITISATVDHRFIDGYQAGVLAQTARACFANPECFGA